ncbi:DUF2069 domain-containing protein [Marinobacter halodurans]|uniref:DUF2069 domain-containing protein n=1 Tax=Marinobacter halodurans TaxID=2528979 RepID=A0ABY1ZMY7_9GAMM|nr:DUF2069 domain-containing protein [Marinobacter halodurans]TBW54501.1 DUF2069 domain-containing protein [Marinobacter halodurans]
MLHSARARHTRLLCQVLYGLLLALLVLTTFWPAPDPALSLPLVLTVKLVPLLLFIPIVIRGDNRGLIWLSFVLIFYFTQFTVSAWLTQGAVVPSINALVTLLLFVSAMVHLKTNRPE